MNLTLDQGRLFKIYHDSQIQGALRQAPCVTLQDVTKNLKTRCTEAGTWSHQLPFCKRACSFPTVPEVPLASLLQDAMSILCFCFAPIPWLMRALRLVLVCRLQNTFFRAGSSLRSSSSTTWETGSAWSAATGWSRSAWTDFFHFSFFISPQLYLLIFLLNYLGGLGLCRVHLEGRVVWRTALLCWLQGVGGFQQEQEQQQQQLSNIKDCLRKLAVKKCTCFVHWNLSTR